jgi:hypothetical protein
MPGRPLRYSGIAPQDDPLHYTFVNRVAAPATASLAPATASLAAATGSSGPATGSSVEAAGTLSDRTLRITPPLSFELEDKSQVAQWAPTVQSSVAGFHPDTDCQGNFTAAKFQANNNCYNYACNIATNSFAQPGRRHMVKYTDGTGQLTQANVLLAAEADGLKLVGDSSMKLSDALAAANSDNPEPGHVVALLISVPDPSIDWKGDFHFVRCDNRHSSSWSQKNGPDQVINLDFEGKPLTDPSVARWVVNQGPASPDGTIAIESVYTFAAWMFVSYKSVAII